MSVAYSELESVLPYLRPFLKKYDSPLSNCFKITPNGLYFQADARDVFKNCSIPVFYALYLSKEELSLAVRLLKKQNPNRQYSQEEINELLFQAMIRLVDHDFQQHTHDLQQQKKETESSFNSLFLVLGIIFILIALASAFSR